MTAWWTALSTDLQIFYAIGIIALAITSIQLVLSLMGVAGDAASFDLDLDLPDADSSSGAGILSSQTLGAFFLGFGWVGAMARSSGLSLLLSVALAIALGVALMFAMFYLIRLLLSLQSKGNLDYATAIGEEATVYVTLPGDDQDGGGQIQLMIQGRTRVASARKASPGVAKPGDRVRITSMLGPTTYNVESISNTQPLQ
ncbi:hypothetical protein [Synoicihabitans lomoniglobus]|uniref:NfeD-like C-terminal domain-containing protein n=1 Tax=Synoicihabitans lomoniglobus TaxID=2909285 RepID=A0AAE9ZXH9_9BACT|nr:hypothetical protein [Opitutaceae bacterium LMO-M01]WED65336.1 hypothetical protein PXH66_00550 [Opitutaceae bacterium LMO-M01]